MKQNYEIHEKPIIVNAVEEKIMHWKKWEYCVCLWIVEDQWLKSLNCKYMEWRIRGRLRRCQNENFEACTENKLPSEWMRLLLLLLLLLTPICKVYKCYRSTGYYKSLVLYNYYRAFKKCLSKSLIFVLTVKAVQF